MAMIVREYLNHVIMDIIIITMSLLKHPVVTAQKMLIVQKVENFTGRKK